MTALRADTPLHTAGICLIPVVRVWLHQSTHDNVIWAVGGREPVAVVIRDSEGLYAMDMAGEAVALDALLDSVGGLAAALKR